MFNAEKPSLEELPSSAQLLRSTIIAALSAVVILVTVVLPAEYAIDPTGIGSALGLTEMGEIKQELAEEAARDALEHGESSSLWEGLLGWVASPANAQEAWNDEITFTLAPGASTEVKMVMQAGDTAEYTWVGVGGRVNFDLHAHGDGQSHTYEKGRGETEGAGQIEATFAGEHGWFWRNRDKSDITVTLQLRGSYSGILRGE